MESLRAQQERMEDLGNLVKLIHISKRIPISFLPAAKGIPRSSDNGNHWLLGSIPHQNIRWGSTFDRFPICVSIKMQCFQVLKARVIFIENFVGKRIKKKSCVCPSNDFNLIS